MSARVLAVEDTPSLRALLQLSLTRAGYRVVLADDGQSAVDLFTSGGHDAVVMDIQMPVMDGLAAVALMRAWEKSGGRAPAPILALTANTEPADLRRCLEAGFSATVRKPFAREDLLAALARELGRRPEPDDRIRVTIDPEFAQLVPGFLDSCRAEVAAMRRALESGDFKTISASSHRLRGSGTSYGFQPVSDESRDIESAARKADATGVRSHLDALGAYLGRVRVIYP